MKNSDGSVGRIDPALLRRLDDEFINGKSLEGFQPIGLVKIGEQTFSGFWRWDEPTKYDLDDDPAFARFCDVLRGDK